MTEATERGRFPIAPPEVYAGGESADDELVLLRASTDVFAPLSDGSLQSVATGMFAQGVREPRTRAVLRVGQDGNDRHVIRYAAGDTQASTLVVDGQPLSGLQAAEVFELQDAPQTNVCWTRAGASTLLQITQTQETTTALPFCPRHGRAVTARTRLFAGSGNFALVRDNAVLFTAASPAVPLAVGDDELILLSTVSYDTVWAVTSTGTEPVETGFAVAGMAARGPVGYLRGTRSMQLVRVRAGAPTQTIAFPAFVTDVAVTAEGGALVTAGGRLWGVASDSVEPVDLGVLAPVAIHPGPVTVLTAPTATASGDGLYAYDEVDGVPRLTLLVRAEEGPRIAMPALDVAAKLASWLIYTTNANSYIATVTRGTTPVLTTLHTSAGPVQTGHYRGTPVVAAGSVFMLEQTTWRQVVSSGGSQLVYAGASASRRSSEVVGWYVWNGDEGAACLASEPERCWSAPPVQLVET